MRLNWFESELEKSFIFRPANLVESKTWRLWSKKIFKPRRGDKIFWPLVGGPGGMLPQKSLKISVPILAENATFWTHQFVVKMLRSSGNRGNWCRLTIKLFKFTAYLEILVMYREGGRISCIPGVSRRNREIWQVCNYIEASWLNFPIFFFTFLHHEKAYSDDF